VIKWRGVCSYLQTKIEEEETMKERERGIAH